MTTRPRGARKWIVSLACLLAWAGAPAGAVAQELDFEHDARLEGYTDKVVLEEGNNAIAWLAFAFCGAIALLGMFKDAKRSHLD